MPIQMDPAEEKRREARYRLNEHLFTSMRVVTELGTAEDVIELAKVAQTKAAEIFSRPL